MYVQLCYKSFSIIIIIIIIIACIVVIIVIIVIIIIIYFFLVGLYKIRKIATTPPMLTIMFKSILWTSEARIFKIFKNIQLQPKN